MLGVYTIVKPAAESGWGAPTTLVLGAVSLALVAAFVVREATARTPLIPLRIFRSRNVSGANAIQALLVAGMFSVFFLGTLYLREVLGFDALEIGLAFLPTTLVMGTLSLRYSERLLMRFGPRGTLLPGLVLIAAGLLLFARVPVDGQYVTDVLPAAVLMGAGVGVSMAALMTLAMSDVSPSEAGLASGPGQHHRPGRWRARAGRAGDALDDPHRAPARRRRLRARGADQWLPARLHRRRRARDRRDRGRAHGAEAHAQARYRRR